MCPTTLPPKLRLTSTTPLAMLKQTEIKSAEKSQHLRQKVKSGNQSNNL